MLQNTCKPINSHRPHINIFTCNKNNQSAPTYSILVQKCSISQNCASWIALSNPRKHQAIQIDFYFFTANNTVHFLSSSRIVQSVRKNSASWNTLSNPAKQLRFLNVFYCSTSNPPKHSAVAIEMP